MWKESTFAMCQCSMPLVSFVLQLETSEHAQAYRLLHLFAYGTLPEYNSEPSLKCCPVLNVL